MLRAAFKVLVIGAGLALAACVDTGYALRPVPHIAADSVGKRVERLQEVFGTPRKMDSSPNKLLYVWFLSEPPAGAPVGLHGCELEVSVDARSEHVLGYSLSNIGWSKCQDVTRKVRVDEH